MTEWPATNWSQICDLSANFSRKSKNFSRKCACISRNFKPWVILPLFFHIFSKIILYPKTVTSNWTYFVLKRNENISTHLPMDYERWHTQPFNGFTSTFRLLSAINSGTRTFQWTSSDCELSRKHWKQVNYLMMPFRWIFLWNLTKYWLTSNFLLKSFALPWLEISRLVPTHQGHEAITWSTCIGNHHWNISPGCWILFFSVRVWLWNNYLRFIYHGILRQVQEDPI